MRRWRAVVGMAVIAATVVVAAAQLHPVVVVPGAGGNQLEARLSADYKGTGWLCSRLYPLKKEEGGWFRLWFDPTVLIPPFTACFAQRMALRYDPHLDDYRNAPGVETRVSHFGSVKSLLYLNPHLKQITSYMAPLVACLEEVGYVDGKTLFGAPYDFRYGLSPEGHPSLVGSKYLQDLKQLIEEASTSNGGMPVVIVSHSLGGLFVIQLVNRNPPAWRQKYIKHLIALSTPWGGTVDEMLTFASGNSLGVPLVNPLTVRHEQRSCESNLWLMPRHKQFGCDTPLVVTPNSTYSSCDIPRFLQDIGFPQGVLPYETRILPLVDTLEAPGVPVTCYVGSGVKTPETLYYGGGGGGGFDKLSKIVYGDGDGTVNMVSLLALQNEWTHQQNQSLKVVKLPGISHTDILKHDTSLRQLVQEIIGINNNYDDDDDDDDDGGSKLLLVSTT